MKTLTAATETVFYQQKNQNLSRRDISSVAPEISEIQKSRRDERESGQS
ncbi:MAG: hypothetical protein LPJ98_04155 [Cyclobacteriaceae bacterium]|nr:hypothetical protein [Cyclobacteriaceae bacterium]